MKKIIYGIALMVLIASCASSYKPIKPDRLVYRTKDENRNIEFYYRYDVLNERGNKKYAKRESRNMVQVAAVKIINNSDKPAIFGKDLNIYSNGGMVTILEPKKVYKKLKQGVAIYLLYLLLTPMELTTDDSSTPIGLAIGPGITIGNMASAASANAKFLDEMESYFLNGRVINPGETVYGIVGILDSGYSPLTLK